MTREEKELALYCLKASSDYHPEVCEECIEYYHCDHTRQNDVTETIIKALEHEPLTDKEQRIFLAAMGREEKVCKNVDKDIHAESRTKILWYQFARVLKER